MQIMDKYVQAGEALAWKENEVLDLTKQVHMHMLCFHLTQNGNGTAVMNKVAFPLGGGNTASFVPPFPLLVMC